ncbi:MAG: ribosome maturation factor RimP [Alphaproteobacteria bacterium]|nr:MAG: ribosome maturation factor RimP [Alphaproteobacteria bacterium]
MATLAEQISGLAQGALAAHGLVLVAARLSGGTSAGRGKLTVDVMAEMPDGSSPTLDLCISAARTLSAQMDVAEILNSPYTLEVGSAGLERPLTRPEDYTRFNGKQAKLTFTRPVANPSGKGVLGTAVGIITQPTEAGLTIILRDGGESLPVTFAQVRDAHLLPNADELKALMQQANQRQKMLKESADADDASDE